MNTNRGIVNHGDHNTFNNNAIGEHARVSPADPSPPLDAPRRGRLGRRTGPRRMGHWCGHNLE